MQAISAEHRAMVANAMESRGTALHADSTPTEVEAMGVGETNVSSDESEEDWQGFEEDDEPASGTT